MGVGQTGTIQNCTLTQDKSSATVSRLEWKRSMKALLLTEYKKLELTDIPVPEISPEEVLIRVRACGICGSDVHGFDGSTGRRIPPVVMGHEASGVIEKI